METKTQKEEEWEGPHLESESENPEPPASSEIQDTGDANERESLQGDEDDIVSSKKEEVPEEPPAKPAEEPAQVTPKSRSSSRTRSKSRRASSQRPIGSRSNSNMSTDRKEAPTETASPKPQKSQPLPSVYEDKDATSNNGQLVKRNRRRNKKSGYESSSTEDMPLRERRQPPQQMQMQPAPQMQMQPPKKNDPMKLRLDLNLEIEVELKARIHGDLTLALLS